MSIYETPGSLLDKNLGWIRDQSTGLSGRVADLEDRLKEIDKKGRNLMQRWHDLGVGVSKLTGEVEALKAQKSDPRFPAGFSTNDVYIPERDEAKKTATFDGRCIVPEERVLRWERIERAALAALEARHIRDSGKIYFARLDELYEALKP